MAFPPTDKTLAGLLADTTERLNLVERRLARGLSSSGGGSTGDVSAVSPGTIVPFGGTVAPNGWLLCDGAAYSRNGYGALFAVVGTSFGAGDGSTTFNVPDLRGRVLFGRDSTQTEFDVLGETGGAKTHNHYQSVGYDGSSWYIRPNTAMPRTKIVTGGSRGTAGLAGAVGNARMDATEDEPSLPPYQVSNYVISVGTGSGTVSPTIITQGLGIAVTGSGSTSAPYVIAGVLATEALAGIAEIATTAEISAGTDDTRFVTPLKLAARIAAIPIPTVAAATETVSGIAELATQAETTAGTDDQRIVTPLKLAQRLALLPAPPAATETVAGVAEVATTAETTAATDDARMITPLKLAQRLASLPATAVPGLVSVIPASVAGTGVSLSGNKIIFTAAAAVSLNGVFDALREDYQVEIRITAFSTAAGGWLRLRAAGVDMVTSGAYGQQQVYNNAAATVIAAYSTTTGWVFTPVNLTSSAKITAKFTNPASAGSEFRVCRIETNGQNSGAIVNATNVGSLAAAVYDGFSLVASTGTITGWLRVYALAG